MGTDTAPPTTLPAIRWTGDNYDAVHEFICAGTNWRNHDADESGCCWADPLPGDPHAIYGWPVVDDWVPVEVGDWITRDPIDNTLSAIRPDGTTR